MSIGLKIRIRKPDAEELVKQKYPTAYVYDDGELVKIRYFTQVTEPCPTCKHEWTHPKIVYPDVLGSGGNASSAWENAANNLGLI